MKSWATAIVLAALVSPAASLRPGSTLPKLLRVSDAELQDGASPSVCAYYLNCPDPNAPCALDLGKITPEGSLAEVHSLPSIAAHNQDITSGMRTTSTPDAKTFYVASYTGAEQGEGGPFGIYSIDTATGATTNSTFIPPKGVDCGKWGCGYSQIEFDAKEKEFSIIAWVYASDPPAPPSQMSDSEVSAPGDLKTPLLRVNPKTGESKLITEITTNPNTGPEPAATGVGCFDSEGQVFYWPADIGLTTEFIYGIHLSASPYKTTKSRCPANTQLASIEYSAALKAVVAVTAALGDNPTAENAVYNTAKEPWEKIYSFGKVSWGLGQTAISPDGRLLYAFYNANDDDDAPFIVSVVDLEAKKQVKKITLKAASTTTLLGDLTAC